MEVVGLLDSLLFTARAHTTLGSDTEWQVRNFGHISPWQQLLPQLTVLG